MPIAATPQSGAIARMTKTRIERRPVDGIVLLDKPQGLSSNQALQIVKRLFRAQKAGHTGSLDPLASGLLPICLGQATKLSSMLLDSSKRYRATVRLGVRTATGDREGAVIATSDPASLTRAALEAAAETVRGAIQQVPPMYSALKRDGRPLYELARAGQEVERAARRVEIHELKLLAFDGSGFEFEVHCSKGTYVRTLAEDWAAAAGQAAHLTALRRVGLGPFKAAQMTALAILERETEADRYHHLLPPDAAVQGWPRISVSGEQARRLAHGQAIEFAVETGCGAVAVFGPGGSLLGLAELDAQGRLAPRRWLADTSAAGTRPAVL